MALVETSLHEFEPGSTPVLELVPAITHEDGVVDQEAELKARFAPEAIGALGLAFLRDTFGNQWQSAVGDRQFVVAYLDAQGPYGDIGRSVEATVFAKYFEKSHPTPLSKVVADYGKYDKGSTFATVIDVTTPVPVPAGELRIAQYDIQNPGLGFKDANDLVVDDPSNPWAEEIRHAYFAPGEAYNEKLAWERLLATEGVVLDMERASDISSHASADQYRGQRGALDGPSMLFFHACLRHALAHNTESLLAIFDEGPFNNVQQFNGPFDTYRHLGRHPYGGPGDTVPAFCLIDRALDRIPKTDPDGLVGAVFVGGETLDKIALMPNEYDSRYSNKSVGL